MERFYIEPTQRRFHRSLIHPHTYQQAIFHHLLRRGRQTAFGQAHDLHAVETQRDFQRAIPVHCYEDLKPYIDRAIAGEPDVLWPGQTVLFAESSGTSGRKKQIPISPEAWKTAYRATAATYVAELISRTDRRRFLRGKTVFFVGYVQPPTSSSQTLFGDVTAFGVYLLPWYLDFSRAPDKQTTLIPNWEERLYRMAAATIGEDVVHLAGLTTWLRNFGQIVLAMTGKRTLREVWPNLMTATVGGVKPGPYLRDLNRLILGQPNLDNSNFFYSEVYNGTEGFYALQIDQGDMVLMPDGRIFYEFVRRDEAEMGNFENAMPLADVELGVDYAPVISNMSGLWRYLIGDTIRFTARNPYRLVVSGRVQQYLNVTGEELLVNTTDAAMRAVCEAHDLALVDYTAAAVKLEGTTANAVHVWLVELADPQAITAERFAEALDRTLIDNHYDYAKSRSEGALTGSGFGLAPPVVFLAPPGTFYRWLQRRLGGQIGAQSKVPRLCNEPTVIAEILSLLPTDPLPALPKSIAPAFRQALYVCERQDYHDHRS